MRWPSWGAAFTIPRRDSRLLSSPLPMNRTKVVASDSQTKRFPHHSTRTPRTARGVRPQQRGVATKSQNHNGKIGCVTRQEKEARIKARRSRKTTKGNQCPLHNGCRYALDWLFRRNQREQGYTDGDEHSRRRIDWQRPNRSQKPMQLSFDRCSAYVGY